MAVIYIGRVGLYPLVSIPRNVAHRGLDHMARAMETKKAATNFFPPCSPCLLDGGVPEERKPSGLRAIPQPTKSAAAAFTTALLQRLEKGVKLDERCPCLRRLRRISLAAHKRHALAWRFLYANALRGWHEALDAKAFQQEEAMPHVITSGLVIMNGLVVALDCHLRHVRHVGHRF